MRQYELDAPVSSLHLDIKKLGRFAQPGHPVTGTRQAGRSVGTGWDYVNVAIDDHARVALPRYGLMRASVAHANR